MLKRVNFVKYSVIITKKLKWNGKGSGKFIAVFILNWHAKIA